MRRGGMSGSGVERCGLQATADRAVTLPRRSRGPGSVLLFIISNIHKISPPLTHAIGRQCMLSSVACSSAASVQTNSWPSPATCRRCLYVQVVVVTALKHFDGVWQQLVNVFSKPDSKHCRSVCSVNNEQLAQCWFPGLASLNAEILIYFSNKIHVNNVIKQHSETAMVWNFQDADCSQRKKNVLCYLL